MKKLLRVWHIVPVSIAVTLIIFMFRFLWFGLEVSADRVGTGIMALIVTVCVSVMIEVMDTAKNETN